MTRLVKAINDFEKKYDEREEMKCNKLEASARLSLIFLKGEGLR